MNTPVNRHDPDRWPADVTASVSLYNSWYRQSAPAAFRGERKRAEMEVRAALQLTHDLTQVTTVQLLGPQIVLPTLRMATCPPMAVDRLVGLARVPKGLVACLESGKRPRNATGSAVQAQVQQVAATITAMADSDLLPWLNRSTGATPWNANARPPC